MAMRRNGFRMPDRAFLSELSDMTNDNRHTEVCLAVAKWYSDACDDRGDGGPDFDYAAIFGRVASIQESEGCLTHDVYAIRSMAMDGMMAEIGRRCGAEISKAITAAM